MGFELIHLAEVEPGDPVALALCDGPRHGPKDFPAAPLKMIQDHRRPFPGPDENRPMTRPNPGHRESFRNT